MAQRHNAHVEAWVSASDYRAMRTASLLMSSYQSEFKGDLQVDLNIHFVTNVCVFCRAVDFHTNSEDCTNGGRYCAPDPDFTGPLTGRDVVLENLKQMCLNKRSP